jgi:hypothetical protein
MLYLTSGTMDTPIFRLKDRILNSQIRRFIKEKYTVTKRPKVSDIVYLRTGCDTEARLITAKTTRDGSTQYELTCGLTSSWHQAFEFQYEQPTGKIKTIKGLAK